MADYFAKRSGTLTGRFAFRDGAFGAQVLQAEVRYIPSASDSPGTWAYYWRDATSAEVRDYFTGTLTREAHSGR